MTLRDSAIIFIFLKESYVKGEKIHTHIFMQFLSLSFFSGFLKPRVQKQYTLSLGVQSGR